MRHALNLRLHFSQAQLSGTSAAANESFVKITSADSGSYQILNSQSLTDWNNSSAYFNGGYVTVELYAYPGTGTNQIHIDYAMTEPAAVDFTYNRSLCGNDDRQRSFDARVVRLHIFKASKGDEFCTAFLFDGKPGHFLTAGHCCNDFEFSNRYRPVIEFHVPSSNSYGAWFSPSPVFQYVVDTSSIDCCVNSTFNTPDYCPAGGDWCVFAVHPNRMTGFYPLQEKGASYSLTNALPSVSAQRLRLAGFGTDKTPTGSLGDTNEDNVTNQFAVGPYVSLSSTTFNYSVDATGGNSGSPVEDTCGQTYGIHTNGGCTDDPDSSNFGWRIDESALQSALANLQGTAATDCNENGIADHCDISCTGCSTPCGGSNDCNHNGIPDECESQADCNFNSVKDICEVYAGTVPDCNHNGVPDSCDIASGLACDCNNNGIPDTCDICVGTSADTNGNWIPDSCEPVTLGVCCGYNGGSCANYLTECECNHGGGTFLGSGHLCRFTGACCGYDLTECTGGVTECTCYAHGGGHWKTGSCSAAHCEIYGPEGGGGDP